MLPVVHWALGISAGRLCWCARTQSERRERKRLLVTVVGWIMLGYGLVVVLAVVDLPTALVCERGRTEVEATPTIQGGRFEEYRVGPCVFFNPESRGGGD